MAILKSFDGDSRETKQFYRASDLAEETKIYLPCKLIKENMVLRQC